MDPTDTERIDRLPEVILQLASQYNWREATPLLTRAAIDLAWKDLLPPPHADSLV